MKVKWGIIGCGNIVKKRIAQAISSASNCHLVAVTDVDIENARVLADQQNIRYYNKVEEFLSNEMVEAVYIATPTNTHSELTIQVAEAGKHILCEKPMSTTIEECRDMINVCQERNVKLMIGFMMRFYPCHQKIRELVETGELGKIVLSRAQFSFPYMPDTKAWQQSKSISGGGALMDVGCHCVDILRFVLGQDVREVMSFIANLTFDYSVEDTASVLLRFENGTQAIVDSCFSTQYSENILEIYGTKGTIIAPRALRQDPLKRINAMLDGQIREYEFPETNPYREEVEHFSNCILEGKEPLSTGNDGLRNLEVILGAYESSKTGKKIVLS